MVDHQRAREVLVRARDILTDRMSELVVQDEAQLLADARGDSYQDEIGRIFEQVGLRLSQLNSMLSDLPSAPDVPPIPAAKTLSAAPAREPGPMTFRSFAEQVIVGDMDAATATLAVLFGIDGANARAATTVFQERLSADPSAIERTMELRSALAEGRSNRALLILHKCFGLTGVVSIQVVQHLRERFSGAA